jgi:2-haloacid dehalogenase
MNKIKNIVFDLGGVLIDWDPNYLYKKIIHNGDERKWFLDTICTYEWNEEQDGGRTIKEATDLLVQQFPAYQEWINAYYDRWEEMLHGYNQGTVEIFKKLKESNQYGIYALTNWSAETFPRALEIFDFLHWFDGRLVSGEENTRKPFKEIYELTISRFNLIPEETIFIDDNLRNITAAKQTGLICIHFTSFENLEKELLKMNVL